MQRKTVLIVLVGASVLWSAGAAMASSKPNPIGDLKKAGGAALELAGALARKARPAFNWATRAVDGLDLRKTQRRFFRSQRSRRVRRGLAAVAIVAGAVAVSNVNYHPTGTDGSPCDVRGSVMVDGSMRRVSGTAIASSVLPHYALVQLDEPGAWERVKDGVLSTLGRADRAPRPTGRVLLSVDQANTCRGLNEGWIMGPLRSLKDFARGLLAAP